MSKLSDELDSEPFEPSTRTSLGELDGLSLGLLLGLLLSLTPQLPYVGEGKEELDETRGRRKAESKARAERGHVRPRGPFPSWPGRPSSEQPPAEPCSTCSLVTRRKVVVRSEACIKQSRERTPTTSPPFPG